MRDWAEGSVAAAIACPAPVLAGEAGLGGVIAPPVAAAIGRLLPAGRVLTIAGARHSVRRDQRVAYLAAVRAFLAEIGP